MSEIENKLQKIILACKNIFTLWGLVNEMITYNIFILSKVKGILIKIPYNFNKNRKDTFFSVLLFNKYEKTLNRKSKFNLV